MSVRSWTMMALVLGSFLGGCNSARPIDSVRASGENFYRAGNYTASRDEFAEIVSRTPGDWRAHYMLGLSQIETGEFSAARRSLEIANTSQPRNQDVANALAEALFRQGDETRLFAFLRQRASTLQTVPAHLQLAKYAMASNDPDSAEVALETAIEIDAAQTTEPYLMMAELQERIGNLDEAIRRLRRAMGINAYDPRIAEQLRRLGEDPSKLTPLPPGR